MSVAMRKSPCVARSRTVGAEVCPERKEDLM
jgi:hypothetical protein